MRYSLNIFSQSTQKLFHKVKSFRQYTQIIALSLAALLLFAGGIGWRLAATSAAGSISLMTSGVAYTENFDTLANSGTSSTVPNGWDFSESLANANTTYTANNGASNSGDTYSYGATAGTERAFGQLRSGNLASTIGASFTNSTGSTITSLSIAYTGEQWRFGGTHSPNADRIDFQYSTDATSLTTGTWIDVNALDFNPPVTAGTAGALDGNAAANRTALSSTISSLNIPGGTVFWIRWTDADASGSDDGLAVDDFSLTPNGGPVTPTLNINDVTQAEGNPPGTTTFMFAVTLTSPALTDVTFDIATADGTAQDGNPGGEDNDYVAQALTGQTIPMGSTGPYNFSVTVNRDTTTEPNETFFVNLTNVTGVAAGDVQGLGTITNDDVSLTKIHDIQGNGSTSPFAGQSIITSGIVTGIKSGTSGGFFIQEPDATVDADPNTSEGVFVFTAGTIPAAAVVGNLVQVSGTVQEFVFTSDPNSPPITEISGTVTTSLLSTGNPLPAPITLTVSNTTAPSSTSNPLDTLEEFEGMRVTVPSLTVIAPTDGTINEPNATVSGNDVFYGVVTGVARPFREAGVNISDPLPAGSPANVPRFDENPERIRVDGDGQPGTTAVDVAAGTVIPNVTGPLDYQFRAYTILPDTTLVPGTQPGSTAAPAPNANELTIVSFNMERFFDTTDAPGISDPVLTTTAFNKRLDKASRIIRTLQRYPDVIGVEEMENLTTLQAVAAKVNADAQSIDGLPNPNYFAYLVEGNDVGGIDVGFLVKQSRVTTVDVTQLELPNCDHTTGSTCYNYTDPNDGSIDILNDRPPLVLRATAPIPGGGTFPFTVIVNHLRSLNGIDDETVSGTGTAGARVREKRRKQAEFLANYIQSRQTSDPNERIISVGDYNAFNVSDGYVDVMGTIKGTPAPANQVVLASSDLVNPDLTNLVDTLLLTSAQRYSYSFDGNAQVLDQVLVNQAAFASVSRFAHVRNDADFPVKNYELANELRISDHDQPIVYLTLSSCTITCSTNVTQPIDPNQCGAVVNYSAPTTSGTCGAVACAPASGSFFSVGVTTVTCSVASGPSCSFTVTVTTASPVLSYSSPQTTVPGQSLVVNPATGPSDNDGTVASIVVQSVTPSTAPGTITVNSLGVVTVPNNVPAGSYTVTIRATDNCGVFTDASFTLNVSCLAITVNPPTLPNGFVGTLYNQPLSATGGTPGYAFTLNSGASPPGLSIVGSSLTGTPTTTGVFNFSIKATDSGGICFGTRAYTVVISGTGLQFYPLAHPIRLVDTRAGASACQAPGTPITGGTSLTVPARGTCESLTIPANAAAVTGNVTTVGPVAAGFLTLYPSIAAQPQAANTNYQTGQTLNNVFTVGLGAADGAFNVFSLSTTNVVVDITGYFAPPGAGGLFFHPLPAPVRLLDTRAMQTACTTPGTPIGANTEVLQQGNAICGIPATASALVGNATTVGPAAQGFLTLFPSNATRPLIASGNYQAGQTLNSPFTVGLSPSGNFTIYSLQQTDLVIDVTGYYSADASDTTGIGLLFSPMTPARLLDTRPLQTACFTPGVAIPATTETPQAARNACTIPATAQAIVGNATTVSPAAQGFLTFWPSNVTRPNAATLNFAAGVNFNRHFTVGLGTDGAFKIYALTSTHLVVDVSGSFAP